MRSEQSKLKTSVAISNLERRSRKPQFCKNCNKEMYPTNKEGKPCLRKTCSNTCRVLINKAGSKRGGLTTSSKTWNARSRSKNERYFAALILKEFPNSLTNKRMFGEYDADVILLDQKIAIHWNGPFHYKPLLGEAHLQKIQARDALRYEAIEQEGYVNYIIDDRDNSGFSAKKVEEEFQRFVQIGTSGGTRTHTTPVSPS